MSSWDQAEEEVGLGGSAQAFGGIDVGGGEQAGLLDFSGQDRDQPVGPDRVAGVRFDSGQAGGVLLLRGVGLFGSDHGSEVPRVDVPGVPVLSWQLHRAAWRIRRIAG